MRSSLIASWWCNERFLLRLRVALRDLIDIDVAPTAGRVVDDIRVKDDGVRADHVNASINQFANTILRPELDTVSVIVPDEVGANGRFGSSSRNLSMVGWCVKFREHWWGETAGIVNHQSKIVNQDVFSSALVMR